MSETTLMFFLPITPIWHPNTFYTFIHSFQWLLWYQPMNFFHFETLLLYDQDLYQNYQFRNHLQKFTKISRLHEHFPPHFYSPLTQTNTNIRKSIWLVAYIDTNIVEIHLKTELSILLFHKKKSIIDICTLTV